VTTIENKTYQQHETVNLDEHVFVNCTFNGPTVIYSATTPFNAINCKFRGDVRWNFAGPAGNMLNFLTGLYANPGSRPIVEAIFQTIRTGVPPQPLPAIPQETSPGTVN